MDSHLEAQYEDRFHVEDRHSDVDEEFDSELDDECDICGGELASDGVCADDLCDNEPDESREYQGPGCTPGCGC